MRMVLVLRTTARGTPCRGRCRSTPSAPRDKVPLFGVPGDTHRGRTAAPGAGRMMAKAPRPRLSLPLVMDWGGGGQDRTPPCPACPPLVASPPAGPRGAGARVSGPGDRGQPGPVLPGPGHDRYLVTEPGSTGLPAPNSKGTLHQFQQRLHAPNRPPGWKSTDVDWLGVTTHPFGPLTGHEHPDDAAVLSLGCSAVSSPPTSHKTPATVLSARPSRHPLLWIPSRRLGLRCTLSRTRLIARALKVFGYAAMPMPTVSLSLRRAEGRLTDTILTRCRWRSSEAGRGLGSA
jgi:hypothetical protein